MWTQTQRDYRGLPVMLKVQAGEGQQERLVDHWRIVGDWAPGVGPAFCPQDGLCGTGSSGLPGLALVKLMQPFTPNKGPWSQ